MSVVLTKLNYQVARYVVPGNVSVEDILRSSRLNRYQVVNQLAHLRVMGVVRRVSLEPQPYGKKGGPRARYSLCAGVVLHAPSLGGKPTATGPGVRPMAWLTPDEREAGRLRKSEKAEAKRRAQEQAKRAAERMVKQQNQTALTAQMLRVAPAFELRPSFRDWFSQAVALPVSRRHSTADMEEGDHAGV